MLDELRHDPGNDEPGANTGIGSESATPKYQSDMRSSAERPTNDPDGGAARSGHAPGRSYPPDDERYDPDALTLLGDVLQQPTKAFSYLALARAERIGLAIVVYVLSQMPFNWFRSPFNIEVPSLPARLVGNAMAAIIGFTVGVAIFHLCARILGGRNQYSKLFQAMAMSTLPSLLTAPFLVLDLSLRTPTLWPWASFVGSVWTLILNVIAVREVHGFSTGRALATLLLPLLLIVAVTVALVVIAALLGLTIFPGL